MFYRGKWISFWTVYRLATESVVDMFLRPWRFELQKGDLNFYVTAWTNTVYFSYLALELGIRANAHI